MKRMVLLWLVGCASSNFDLGTTRDSALADTTADGTADAPADTSGRDTSPGDTATGDAVDSTPGCVVAPYGLGGDVPKGGTVCGVGDCRKLLTGECPAVSVDGGTSVCAALYPAEKLGDGKDDNCNGVIDEGYPVAQSPAGFECTSCAFGRKVRRKADGTLDTVTPGNFYGDYENNPGCMNSELCKLNGVAWVRHAGLKGSKSCTDFCAAIGQTCKPACSTTSPACKAEAVKSGLGSFAADYQCMSGTTPLVGDCAATLPAVTPSNAFNVYCCCSG